jgi:hypothetical protein
VRRRPSTLRPPACGNVLEGAATRSVAEACSRLRRGPAERPARPRRTTLLSNVPAPWSPIATRGSRCAGVGCRPALTPLPGSFSGRVSLSPWPESHRDERLRLRGGGGVPRLLHSHARHEQLVGVMTQGSCASCLPQTPMADNPGGRQGVPPLWDVGGHAVTPVIMRARGARSGRGQAAMSVEIPAARGWELGWRGASSDGARPASVRGQERAFRGKSRGTWGRVCLLSISFLVPTLNLFSGPCAEQGAGAEEQDAEPCLAASRVGLVDQIVARCLSPARPESQARDSAMPVGAGCSGLRLNRTQEVAGSSPASSIKQDPCCCRFLALPFGQRRRTRATNELPNSTADALRWGRGAHDDGGRCRTAQRPRRSTRSAATRPASAERLNA